jgi:hypothetical protein
VGRHVFRTEVNIASPRLWAATTGCDWRTERASARRYRSWNGYTQARIGNVHAPETTGKFVAATFEHDTARPVDGYAAPQLHTHAVIFNVTERDNGQTRALQPHEIFVSQRYVTAVYRSELALRLEKLGYELERGKHGQPEIKGYTKGVSGGVQPTPGADQGPSPRARNRRSKGGADCGSPHARQQGTAVTGRSLAEASRIGRAVWAPGRSSCRSGANTRAAPNARTGECRTAGGDVGAGSCLREIGGAGPPRDSRISLGTRHGRNHLCQHRQEFERRIKTGEFREVGQNAAQANSSRPRPWCAWSARSLPGCRKATSAAIAIRCWFRPRSASATEDRHPELSASQRQAVDSILISREKIVGLDGVAGAGKTTTLSVIREAAVAEGYHVEGFAPTSRAAQKLSEAGMETSTIQKHLARSEQPDTAKNGCTCSTNPRWHRPGSCMSLYTGSIQMTECCWLATGGSMKPLRPGGPLRNFRTQA